MSGAYQTNPYGNEPPNTSGQGRSAELPDGLGRLNWGALGFSWIWGLGNRTYIALLSFIPPLNFVMPFVLLFKGNKWAWQNDTWRSLDHFREVQRNWAIAAAIIYGGITALFIVLPVSVYLVIGNLEPIETAKQEAATHPDIEHYLGAPVEVSWWYVGAVNTHNQTGDADVTVFVSGPIASGSLRMVSVRQNGVWMVRRRVLSITDTGQTIKLPPPSG